MVRFPTSPGANVRRSPWPASLLALALPLPAAAVPITLELALGPLVEGGRIEPEPSESPGVVGGPEIRLGLGWTKVQPSLGFRVFPGLFGTRPVPMDGGYPVPVGITELGPVLGLAVLPWGGRFFGRLDLCPFGVIGTAHSPEEGFWEGIDFQADVRDGGGLATRAALGARFGWFQFGVQAEWALWDGLVEVSRFERLLPAVWDETDHGVASFDTNAWRLGYFVGAHFSFGEGGGATSDEEPADE